MNLSTVKTAELAELRGDFPILKQTVHANPLVYLDNAATTQKPQAVIDSLTHFYANDNANVHRATHLLSDRATQAFEAARTTLARFINSASSQEIVWTRGTTEAINLVANSYGSRFGPGDEILISEMEHHSNIVPWQLLAERTGVTIKAIKVTPEGELDLLDFQNKLDERTVLVSLVYVSNALGTINPVSEIIQKSHQAGARVLLDAAQAAIHLPIDVTALNCDFLALSGHKMFGPTGIGALYGKESLLDSMPPWQGGGEMIETVTLQKTRYNQLPYKFEAGTPHIAGAIGLATAIDYIRGIDSQALAQHEKQLLDRTISELQQIPGIVLVGTPAQRSGIVSFLMDGAHPSDIGTLLDQQGIAVRTGHHCAMPLMQSLAIPGTVRASFCAYNSLQDVERLIEGIRKTAHLFGGIAAPESKVIT